MRVNIKEDYRTIKDINRNTVMSNEEMIWINDAIATLNDNIGNMQKYYEQWEKEEEAYQSEQPLMADLPNSRMNIINAAVEGIISQVVNPNLAVMTKGMGPDDDEFANWGKIGLDWALNQNRLQDKLTLHERRRNKHGEAWFKIVWDFEFGGGQGLPVIKVPPLNKVFVDTKVANWIDIEDAEYIAETINKSKYYAEQTYGEEKANIIDYGVNQYRDNGVFQEDSIQDEREWTLIQWWSKEEGMLRLREFSGCGVLLYDSWKEGDRKEQDQDSAINPKNFYKYAKGYGYFFTVKYTKEGTCHGFGDAKLLLPLQNMINELYDKIRIQMRPNIVLIDSNSEVDISSFDDNSFNPYPFDGSKVRGSVPIYSVAWGQISAETWKLLDNLHTEAQRIIRFSDLMTGQQSSSQTATEAAIAQSQGNSHSEREKMLLESTLSRVATFMLSLMMEHFVGGRAFRISGEEAKFEWINFSKMSNVPALQPASQEYKNEFRQQNPTLATPEWEHVTNERGKPVTKVVELDIETSIGSGLPKNKAFVWQMIEKLAAMTGIDMSSGQAQQKPLLDYKELREFIKTYLGIPIQDEDEMEKFMQKLQQNQTNLLSGLGQTSQEPPQQMPQSQMAMPGGQESTEGLAPGGQPAQNENMMIKAGG